MASIGTYSGVLQRIDVKGETERPDLALRRGEAPVRLHFSAIARGTKKRHGAGEAAGTVDSDLRCKFKLRNAEVAFSPRDG